ncbi:MAG TPA: hypothetical protein VG944_18450 [Fimbriimonas sp.]|nr:hypothetical protein [Fimbriimonas sp.]
MKESIYNSEHPIRLYFANAINDAFEGRLGIYEEEVEEYLTSMLVAFLHLDSVYGLHDKQGRSVTSVAEMVMEGDIRLNADSFDREREVHRHIGDFLLFWSGLFPEYLRYIKAPLGKDALLDPVGQGRMSYKVASSFEHDPYGNESKVLRRLSEKFETYQYGLGFVRAGFEGFRRQGWPDGFNA